MKSELRTLLRATRRTFVAERGGNELVLDRTLEVNFKSLINNAKCVAAYCAKGSECDVMAAVFAAISSETAIALPCAVSKSQPLVFRRWHVGNPLITGPLGFDEPAGNAKEIAPDLILAPLLGFDRALNRLGQGAGHYDRAFASFPNALRIGVAWSCQEVDAIPTDPWDLPLDGVITEQEWISAPDPRILNERT